MASVKIFKSQDLFKNTISKYFYHLISNTALSTR